MSPSFFLCPQGEKDWFAFRNFPLGYDIKKIWKNDQNIWSLSQRWNPLYSKIFTLP